MMNGEVGSNEQWLLEGDCSKCRRGNYCSKDCGAFKKRKNKIMKKAFEKAMVDRYGEDFMSELYDKVGDIYH